MRVTLELDAGRPWRELAELATRAEQAGWDAVRVEDTRGGECWAVIAALAAAVPRVRLDAVVRDDRGRHPAVVAKQAATVDQLSGGRLLLGLVSAPDAGGEARLAEACEIVTLLATRERSTFEGRFYRLANAPLSPKPIQQPIPLMLVGTGPGLVAQWADHWSITGSPSAIRSHLEELTAACQASDRNRHEITVSARLDGAASFPEYAGTGVDEWVVPAATLGPETLGPAGRERLARIRAETRPAAAGAKE